jgi:hypothetical protein
LDRFVGGGAYAEQLSTGANGAGGLNRDIYIYTFERAEEHKQEEEGQKDTKLQSLRRTCIEPNQLAEGTSRDLQLQAKVYLQPPLPGREKLEADELAVGTAGRTEKRRESRLDDVEAGEACQHVRIRNGVLCSFWDSTRVVLHEPHSAEALLFSSSVSSMLAHLLLQTFQRCK